MRLFLIRKRLKSILIKSCSRWSIFAALVLYVGLFAFIIFMKIPLKSDKKEKTPRVREGFGDISEYLHSLHNLKSKNEMSEEEKEKIRPITDLEDMFHKADTDKDNYLSMDEVSKYISLKTQEHIHEAVVESFQIFVDIDQKPKDGHISWNEYHTFFLDKNGMNKTYISDHSENHKDLMRNMKEAIMRDKAAWSECAKTDPSYLTLDEFLSFRHPESSYSSMLSLVDDIFKKFDRDQDDTLTEDEFSTLQSEDEFIRPESSYQEEEEKRRKEFRELVDLNSDGKATRKEMLTYVDPKNPRHAREEAENLLSLADQNKDGLLSLHEIFLKMDLFLESKMVDTARNFHDEF